MGICGILTWSFSYPSCLSWSRWCARMGQVENKQLFCCRRKRFTWFGAVGNTTPSDGVSRIHDLRDGQVGRAKSSTSPRRWSWWQMCWLLSCVLVFETPQTVSRQAPLSMGFPRQHCWSGLPFPSPGDLPDPGIKHITKQRNIEQRKSNNRIC